MKFLYRIFEKEGEGGERGWFSEIRNVEVLKCIIHLGIFWGRQNELAKTNFYFPSTLPPLFITILLIKYYQIVNKTILLPLVKMHKKFYLTLYILSDDNFPCLMIQYLC